MTSVGGAHMAPLTFERAPCGGDGGIDIGAIRFSDVGDDLLICGVDGFEIPPRLGWQALPADQDVRTIRRIRYCCHRLYSDICTQGHI
jgi:hypothetical protein